MTLLVVPAVAGDAARPAVDVELAAARLALAGVPLYEARQQMLRLAPFLVAVDVERARGAAVELRGLGVEAWAVDAHAFASSPPPEVARRFRLFGEGIEVTTRATPSLTHAVRFSAVELLVTARSARSTRREDVQIDRSGDGRSEIVSTVHRHDKNDERFVIVLAREPNVVLRFDMHGLEYLGLGDERQPVARANYDTLVGKMRTSCAGARYDDRLEKDGWRINGKPTGAGSSTTAAGFAGGISVSTTFGEDNAGGVVNAARLLCLAERLRRGGGA